MTKEEVQSIARKAMNFNNPGEDRYTSVPADTVEKDEVDQGDNENRESNPNRMNYCPGCGMKLR